MFRNLKMFISQDNVSVIEKIIRKEVNKLNKQDKHAAKGCRVTRKPLQS